MLYYLNTLFIIFTLFRIWQQAIPLFITVIVNILNWWEHLPRFYD